MRTGLVRIALISAFALASPFLTFAGSQKGETPQPAAQQPTTRVVIRTNTVNIETPQQPACVVVGKHTCPNWQDTQAFHK